MGCSMTTLFNNGFYPLVQWLSTTLHSKHHMFESHCYCKSMNLKHGNHVTHVEWRLEWLPKSERKICRGTKCRFSNFLSFFPRQVRTFIILIAFQNTWRSMDKKHKSISSATECMSACADPDGGFRTKQYHHHYFCIKSQWKMSITSKMLLK